MSESETPKQPEVANAPSTQDFKKEPSTKVVISEDEFKSLEAKVLASKKAPSEEESYKKAFADVPAELEQANKASLEESAKAEQARVLAEMRAEIEALKSRPVSGGRKGIAAVPPAPAEGLFRKQPDGRFAIPVSVLAEATKEVMFKDASKRLRL